MAGSTYENLECSVARALERIGDRWTSLILRDAFYGVRRFDDFQSSLGVARNILTDRLKKLVESGIMRKVPYQDRPTRYEYRLTEKGRDLIPIVTSLMAWGDKWESDAPPVRLVHTSCGKPMHGVAVCSECREDLDAFNLTIDPIPDIVTERLTERATSH